jgi:transcriptional regulator with XRE-family HTH domain
MSDITLGQLIRSNRRRLGISMRLFAKQLELSSGYISQIEHDKCPSPSEKTLTKMEGLFGMERDTLLIKAGRIPHDIIVGLLKYPGGVPYLRGRFEIERIKADNAQTLEVSANGQ